ncbi:MAG: ABC transporter permease [Thermoleophilia bacterium]|nr:ABC transporter permease [Thermoleophilia bacterium]
MSQTEKEILGGGAGLAGAVAIETGTELGELEIKARGYWEQVWRRFKRDKAAMVGGITIIFLFLLAFIGAPIASAILGHGPNDLFYTALTPQGQPIGPFSTVADPSHPGHSTFLIFGADSTLGRDEFLRILYGGQVSFEVAILSTIGAISVGVLLGSLAGYFRGWVDTLVSRLTDITMAFPQLLFIIALASTVGDSLNNITFGIFGPGVVTLFLVFTVFGWYYPARIIRAVVLSIREKEFVEAARMVGSSDWRIIRSHILPHLVAPIIVYSTLSVASFILLEAGLSYLNVGIKLPTASWGNLLQQASEFYLVQPWLMVWPGLALLVTTLAFNLLGDGLRDAFDPRATH